MIDWVLAAARGLGWPEQALHVERFIAPAIGEPYAVRLARSDLSVRVGSHQSMLEAIEAAGVDAPIDVPRRRLRPVRDGGAGLRRHPAPSRPLPDRRRESLGNQGDALRVPLRGIVAGSRSLAPEVPHGHRVSPRDVPRRLHVPQQRGRHPPLPVPLRPRRLHVRGQHRAARQGAARDGLREPDRRRRALRGRDARPGAGAEGRPAALPVAASHDAGRMGPPGTPDGAAGRGLPGAFRTAPRRRPLALDQPAARHRRQLHLRGRVDPALRADGIHHAAVAGRFLHPRPARRQSVDGCRPRDHPGRLVARFRHRHELHGMARAGAARPRDGRVRPRLEVHAEPAPGPADAPLQLDHDGQPAPRHQPRDLPQMGHGPHDRDAGERRPQGASPGRAAELLAPAALQRHRVPDPLLPHRARRTRHRAEVGAAHAPRAARPARRPRDLQGPDPLAADRARLPARYDDGAPTSPGFAPE